jgi:hypothetical protein
LGVLLDALLDAGVELAGVELGATLLLLLDAGTELGVVLEVALPSIPQGAGSAAQLVRPTQLC